MGLKGRAALAERSLLNHDFVPISEGMSILPEDTREYTRALQALPAQDRVSLLPRALLAALHRSLLYPQCARCLRGRQIRLRC